jgi:hypothetical protein
MAKSRRFGLGGRGFLPEVRSFLPGVRSFLPEVRSFLPEVRSFLPEVRSFQPADGGFALLTFCPRCEVCNVLSTLLRH